MHRGLLATLLVAPGVLVGAAIALSPDPSGPWTYPLGQRLLYIHVPLAWVAYLGFAVSVVAALVQLTRPRAAAARVLFASNEVTTVLAGAALVTGLAWSYEYQLYDPLADPKVLATFVLVAVLAGLWALAANTPPHRRASLVAGLTTAGFVAVPASYFASRLASPHPDFTREAESISTEMTVLLLVASLGMTMLYAGLVVVRARVLAHEEGA